ncbi:uncharacterized protein N7482_005027 [Penicillium canariense]|uniref:Serine hydrolase domain-containing protein n=1 Tax=Penicillium canariense TaxID=189055 RepID=A0A9W9I350_9EURO|nr:uncharacterized protein N7482_005027 [Penicillium canariense]KAJ5166246.1 hypothetical protein N7482_005027 [Penicillium canariense]
MRFFCLPGGLCNAKVKPILSDLNKDGETTSFVYTQGKNPVTVPPEFEGFFGPPPNFTFIDGDPQVASYPIRTLGQEGSPEDAIRKFYNSAGLWKTKDAKSVLDPLLDQIDQDPAIEGIIGFSEGAGIAASLIVEEGKREKATGRVPRLKCAIFMAGMPPMDSATGRYLLQDEDGQLISIPTVHIMGTQDAMISGTMALYNVCDPDTADLFDHGGGHIIPRDAQTVTEVVKIIRTMVSEL